MKLSIDDLKGKYKLNINLSKSMKKPVTDTNVTRIADSWYFPEHVEIYNHKDVYLYALGIHHVWRTSDLETWELVK